MLELHLCIVWIVLQYKMDSHKMKLNHKMLDISKLTIYIVIDIKL